MEKSKSISKFTAKDLAETGMMAAIIFAGTYLNIPYYVALQWGRSNNAEGTIYGIFKKITSSSSG